MEKTEVPWYRRGHGYNLRNRNRWVAKWATGTPPGARVLDVGAGSGRYRQLFSHCDYLTQDFCETPEMADKYTSIDYLSDVCSIPVQEASFDVILCTEVLEHVPDPIAAVREMGRIVRVGGLLLLTAPLGSFLHQEPFHFYGGFTPHWYHRFLPEVGLRIQELEANQGFFSWFGQEAIRYATLIHPRNTRKISYLDRLWVTALWLALYPFLFGLFPLLGQFLDRLNLEAMATVGYHVAATKEG
jgi:SAM-dependent methyltransferase